MFALKEDRICRIELPEHRCIMFRSHTCPAGKIWLLIGNRVYLLFISMSKNWLFWLVIFVILFRHTLLCRLLHLFPCISYRTSQFRSLHSYMTIISACFSSSSVHLSFHVLADLTTVHLSIPCHVNCTIRKETLSQQPSSHLL